MAMDIRIISRMTSYDDNKTKEKEITTKISMMRKIESTALEDRIRITTDRHFKCMTDTKQSQTHDDIVVTFLVTNYFPKKMIASALVADPWFSI